VADWRAPIYPGDETCFGCGPENGEGLQLQFRRTGAGEVEADCVVPEHLCGAPAVVHGGIQATILDEVMGKAVHLAFDDGQPRRIVTAELAVKYRRPAPIGALIVARGELLRQDGRNIYVRGTLLDGERQELTSAEARWVVMNGEGR
jgi:uncharacterized protein (TIGR00369 family)